MHWEAPGRSLQSLIRKWYIVTWENYATGGGVANEYVWSDWAGEFVLVVRNSTTTHGWQRNGYPSKHRAESRAFFVLATHPQYIGKVEVRRGGWWWRDG